MWDNAKLLRYVLGASLIFRLVFALRFSYLHPDEHLQGPQEIVQGAFGWAAQTPWEFTSDHPVRSFVPLWLMYGIPTSFFTADTHPVYILYTLRLMFAIATWVLEDMAVDRLASTRNNKLRALFFVSTSYVTLTWQAHTLSNSAETVLILWCLVILVELGDMPRSSFVSPMDRHYDMALLGIIYVLGVFNRPTFLAFLLLPSLSLLKLFYRFPATLLTFTVAATIAFGLCVSVDTLLYGHQNGWVITPLNFVKYNLSSSNLETHGIHNRFTHLLVNIPQLLGPGILLLRPNWFSLPMQTAVGALAVLSAIPHQEARFLLPLVPILCSQMDIEQFKSYKVKKYMLILWISFNLVLGVMMGTLHQAGVVPAQETIRQYEKPATVIWWKTYTPPLWLTGLQSGEVKWAELSSAEDPERVLNDILKHDKEVTTASSVKAITKTQLTVIDLQGSDPELLELVLARASHSSYPLYLVAPSAKSRVLKPLLEPYNAKTPVWHTKFHLDPDLLDFHELSTLKLGLDIWNLTTTTT